MSDVGGFGVTLLLNQSLASNQTNINGSTHCGPVNTSANFVFIALHSLVFVVGLSLNSFTLKVYFYRAHQQAASSLIIYLKNLAASDFLICLCLPLRIANYAVNSGPINQVFCSIGSSIFYLNMYASIAFMGYIAANRRYLKIVHHFETNLLQTVRAARIICTLTWVFFLVFAVLYITMSLPSKGGIQFSVPTAVRCEVLQSKELDLVYKIIHTGSTVLFLFVLFSLVFFYYSTSRRLSVAQQRQPASSGSKNLAKSRRNMLVLVSVFCVCFVPYHLVRLPYTFLWRQCSWSHGAFFYLKELTIMVSVLNVCLDPFIYLIFCKAFRAQLSQGGCSATRRL